MGIARFLLKRAAQGIAVVWAVVTIIFAMRFVSPTSPITFIAPLDASQQLRRRIAEKLGLDEPIWVQYLDYLWGLLHLDMGQSYIWGSDVSSLVMGRLPVTVELAIAATIVAGVLSIPLGVVSATNRHDPPDYAATTFSLVGISTPNFWLGLMLVLVLSVHFNVFPVSGVARYRGDVVLFVDGLRYLLAGNATPMIRWFAHMTLPAVTLGTYFTALVTRLTRSGMLDELGKSYVRALRAKGLPETLIRYRHALKNTLIPIITVLGLQLGTLIGGAVVTEAVFNYPGLGSLLVKAIRKRAWLVIQGSLIVISTGFVLVNTVVDVLYVYINPEVEM